ncbi:hypothetical protein [Megalodesulfovibrio gigas]|uniref:hypothetical protein n=1 Tax=Megalodesulfovibrio gigas TaxID=879 RepID=UPI0011858CD5|nr:hypothetical protein [Megalodesulfovibrio gigas]
MKIDYLYYGILICITVSSSLIPLNRLLLDIILCDKIFADSYDTIASKWHSTSRQIISFDQGHNNLASSYPEIFNAITDITTENNSTVIFKKYYHHIPLRQFLNLYNEVAIGAIDDSLKFYNQILQLRIDAASLVISNSFQGLIFSIPKILVKILASILVAYRLAILTGKIRKSI